MEPQIHGGLMRRSSDFDYGRVNVVRHNHLFLYFCFDFLRRAACYFGLRRKRLNIVNSNGSRK